MSSAGREGRDWKRIELQLDTAQILLVVAMLLGLCASSFYLGRWMERDRWSGAASKGSGTAGPIPQTAAGTDLTFFDTLGGKTAAEPSRQARSTPPAKAPAGASTPSGASQGEVPGEAAEGPAELPTGVVGAAHGAIPAPSPAKERPAATRGAFAVQVFSGDKEQAERIAASLSRKGYAARTAPSGTSSSAVRVRLYGYKTRYEATHAAERLKAEDHLNPWVVKAD